MTALQTEIETTEVFDVSNWLERASTRTSTDYVPRHRADVPVDYVA